MYKISALLVKYFKLRFQMVSSMHWESSKCNLVTSYGDYWARVFRSLYGFRIKKDQFNECANSIVICEIFQIEVSDGLIHQLGSCQNINLYPARVYRGTSFFRSLYAFRDPNDN